MKTDWRRDNRERIEWMALGMRLASKEAREQISDNSFRGDIRSILKSSDRMTALRHQLFSMGLRIVEGSDVVKAIGDWLASECEREARIEELEKQLMALRNNLLFEGAKHGSK